MSLLNKQFSYLKRRAKIAASKHFERQITAYEKRRLKKVLGKFDNLILIYTIGKVGSASIYKSIKHQVEFVDYPVFHLHSLSPTQILEQKKYYKSSQRKSVPFHLIQAAILSGLLPEYQGEIYIFTLIREPIQREVSSIFQDSFNFTNSQHVGKSGISQVVREKINALIHDLPENKWFERELKAVFGFDVFTADFDPKTGFAILQNGKTKLAFIRLENLEVHYQKICQELFEMSIDFELLKTNVSGNKFYKEDYEGITNEIALSEEELEKVTGTEFIQKFYPDFIPVIKEKWRKKS